MAGKTDNVGCDGTGDFLDCGSVAVNELVANPSFKVYPNSANNFIVIAIQAKQSQANTVELYNIQGQLIMQIVMSSGVETSLTIDVSNLQKGVYIIRIGKQTKKLIVE